MSAPTSPGFYWALKGGAWAVVQVHDPGGRSGKYAGPEWLLVDSSGGGFLNCPVEHFCAEAWGPRLEPPS